MISNGNLGSFPLHASAEKNRSDTILALLGSTGGIDVNLREPDKGQTALHIAAALNHVESVEALLSKGAKVDIQDKDGETPLSLATKLKQSESVALLKNRLNHNGPAFLIASPLVSTNETTRGNTKTDRRKAKVVLEGGCAILPGGNTLSPGAERRARGFTLAEERGSKYQTGNESPKLSRTGSSSDIDATNIKPNFLIYSGNNTARPTTFLDNTNKKSNSPPTHNRSTSNNDNKAFTSTTLKSINNTTNTDNNNKNNNDNKDTQVEEKDPRRATEAGFGVSTVPRDRSTTRTNRNFLLREGGDTGLGMKNQAGSSQTLRDRPAPWGAGYLGSSRTPAVGASPTKTSPPDPSPFAGVISAINNKEKDERELTWPNSTSSGKELINAVAEANGGGGSSTNTANSSNSGPGSKERTTTTKTEEEFKEYKKKACNLLVQVRGKWAEERQKNGALQREVAVLKEQLARRAQTEKQESQSKEDERRETIVMMKESFSLEKLLLQEEIESLKHELQGSKKKYLAMVEENEQILQKLENAKRSRKKWFDQCKAATPGKADELVLSDDSDSEDSTNNSNNQKKPGG